MAQAAIIAGTPTANALAEMLPLLPILAYQQTQ